MAQPFNVLVSFLKAVNFNTQDVSNFKFENLVADPMSPVEGQIWYNVTTHKLKQKINGTVVIVAPSGGLQGYASDGTDDLASNTPKNFDTTFTNIYSYNILDSTGEDITFGVDISVSAGVITVTSVVPMSNIKVIAVGD